MLPTKTISPTLNLGDLLDPIDLCTRWRLRLSCFVEFQASVPQALQLHPLLECPVRHMLCTCAGCDAGRVILCEL